MEKSSLKKSPAWPRGLVYYARRFLGKKPTLVNLEVTKRCNAKCRFCDYWKEDHHDELTDYSAMVKYFRPVVLAISGGEPLVRKDLADIVRSARPYCHYMTMVSNGCLLNEDRVEELSQAGMNHMAISLDFLGKEHDIARGVPRLFEKVTTIVPQLISKGYKIGFNTVIMESNLEHIVPIIQKTKEWGATISFSCYCGLKKNDFGEMIAQKNYERLQEIVREIESLKKQKGYKIKNSNYYLEHIPIYFRDGEIPNCKAGVDWVHIKPNGYVKPCSELDEFCHFSEYKREKAPKIDCCKCWYACRGEAQANHLAPDRLMELLRS